MVSWQRSVRERDEVHPSVTSYCPGRERCAPSLLLRQIAVVGCPDLTDTITGCQTHPPFLILNILTKTPWLLLSLPPHGELYLNIESIYPWRCVIVDTTSAVIIMNVDLLYVRLFILLLVGGCVLAQRGNGTRPSRTTQGRTWITIFFWMVRAFDMRWECLRVNFVSYTTVVVWNPRLIWRMYWSNSESRINAHILWISVVT